jgi:hypothetical protein
MRDAPVRTGSIPTHRRSFERTPASDILKSQSALLQGLTPRHTSGSVFLCLLLPAIAHRFSTSRGLGRGLGRPP